MKKGTYVASTQAEGSVMFRINAEAYTIRKGKDIEVLIKDERAKVTFPASYMTLTLKADTPKSESEPKAEVKKEIEEVAPIVKGTKVEEPKVEVKPEVETKDVSVKGKRKTVTIETEEK